MNLSTLKKFKRWQLDAMNYDDCMVPPTEEYAKHPKRKRAYLRGWYDAMSNVMEELERD